MAEVPSRRQGSLLPLFFPKRAAIPTPLISQSRLPLFFPKRSELPEFPVETDVMGDLGRAETLAKIGLLEGASLGHDTAGLGFALRQAIHRVPDTIQQAREGDIGDSLMRALGMVGQNFGQDFEQATAALPFGQDILETRDFLSREAKERGIPPLAELLMSIGFPDGGDFVDIGQAMVKAFHGGPRRFSKFSSEFIGTGEGAQAFGHGHYFAENKGVAHSYRSASAEMSGRVGDAPYNPNNPMHAAAWEAWRKDKSSPEDLEALAWLDDRAAKDYSRMAEELRASRASGELPADTDQYLMDLESKARWYEEKADAFAAMSRGEAPWFESDIGEASLFDVEIDVEPEDLLDWDAPLSEQSPQVREALERLRSSSDTDTQSFGALRDALQSFEADSTTGETIYRTIQQGDMGRDPRVASEALAEAGIPGIRYLDQASRTSLGGEIVGVDRVSGGFRSKIKFDANTRLQGAPPTLTKSPVFGTEDEAMEWARGKVSEGTRNIVVFPDAEDRITIKAINGEPVKP